MLSVENTPSRPRSASTGRRHSSSRELVLRTVEAQSSPVSIAALARATGLHENTLRGHLDRLREDGYVARVRERTSGRGRPAWLWRPLAAGESSPYAALAGVLAGTIARTSPDPQAEARRAGSSWGRDVAADLPAAHGPDAARAAVLAVMEGQGFAPDAPEEPAAPELPDAPAADGEITLRQCPLLESATRHPEVVCAVHRGMIDGVLETVGAGADVELIPFTGPGTCTLRLSARAS